MLGKLDVNIVIGRTTAPYPVPMHYYSSCRVQRRILLLIAASRLAADRWSPFCATVDPTLEVDGISPYRSRSFLASPRLIV